LHRDLNWWGEKGLSLVLQPRLVWHLIQYKAKTVTSDCLHPFGFYNYPYRTIFLAGMALGGTTWLKNLLARVPGYYTRPAPMPDRVKNTGGICDSAFRHVPRRGNTLFKTHLRPTQENIDCVFRNGVEKLVIMYRDPRDVVISRYYRLLDFPKPPPEGGYKDYRGLSREAIISHHIEIINEYFIPWIFGWFEMAKQRPECFHFVRFEELKKDTVGTFKEVLEFYDIKLTDEKIHEIVEQCKGKGDMKQNFKKAQFQPWGYSSNFRSGKTGGWKEELTAQHIQKCKDLFGRQLVELNYEQDLNW